MLELTTKMIYLQLLVLQKITHGMKELTNVKTEIRYSKIYLHQSKTL